MMTPKRTPTLSAGESGGVLIGEPFWSKAQSLAAAPGSKGVQRDGNPHHNPPTKWNLTFGTRSRQKENRPNRDALNVRLHLVEVYLKSLVKPMFPRYRYKKSKRKFARLAKNRRSRAGSLSICATSIFGGRSGTKNEQTTGPKKWAPASSAAAARSSFAGAASQARS